MGIPLVSRGMRVFTLVWFGQIFSIVGSSLTGFALGIWLYQKDGSVTEFALISLLETIPEILLSPIAGVVADRWDRRLIMIISDFCAGICTLILALLLSIDRLENWHIYLITGLISIFSTFQLPAYDATTPLIVPKQQLDRANSMIELGESFEQLISPILAGVLLTSIQLHGILFVDFLTFIFSTITLICVRFPKHKTSTSTKVDKSSWISDLRYGCNYIITKKGLFALVVFFSISNFGVGVVQILFTPLVLSFSSPSTVGIIMSISGVGLLLGSLMVFTYGGPQNKINTLLIFEFLGGICILIAGLRTSVPLVGLAVFLFFFGEPISNTAVKFILQRKVAVEVQGRVFGLMDTITGASLPLAYLIAAPLADTVFEPLMSTNGLLAPSIGTIIGIGKGRGIGLMFIITGAFIMLVTLLAYQYSPLRLLEKQLPDAINKTSET